MGISFYTFQAISYILDVYWKKGADTEKHSFILRFIITMFPQLIAGPIVRYADIEEQLRHRKINIRKIGQGAELFIMGLCEEGHPCQHNRRGV